MGFDKVKIKQISGLMLLGAALILALIYSNVIIKALIVAFQIISPFIAGGVIAFVLNLPMRLIENKLLAKWKGRAAGKLKRPVSMVLALVFVLLIINIVLVTVIPQLSKTIVVLGNKIPAFTENAIERLDRLSKDYPQIREQVDRLKDLEINWESLGNNVLDFLKSGFGDVVTSTVSVASSIIGSIVNFFISLVFALYVLSQKEKLENQGRRILTAYLPKKVCGKIEHIFSLLYRNFSNFISGQCLEAVILGTMFVIAMTLFRMPYAVMVGVLIAFTALIPIVGAFIGCIIGTFLILIENPMQALVFFILFQVLQQIEGNLIYPRVVGSSVGLPSIWVLMAVSVGGSLFGIPGMLTFIPLLSTVYALLRENVNERNAAGTAVIEEAAAARADAIAGEAAAAGEAAEAEAEAIAGETAAAEAETAVETAAAAETLAVHQTEEENAALKASGQPSDTGRKAKKKRKHKETT